MGSLGAMACGSKDRYFQTGSKKLVPEGVEGRVPYKGMAFRYRVPACGGIRSGMGYCGCNNVGGAPHQDEVCPHYRRGSQGVSSSRYLYHQGSSQLFGTDLSEDHVLPCVAFVCVRHKLNIYSSSGVRAGPCIAVQSECSRAWFVNGNGARDFLPDWQAGINGGLQAQTGSCGILIV